MVWLSTLDMFLLKNPRAANQIRYLATQMYPGETRFLTQAYADATQNPFQYLFLDFKQSTPEELRVRADILEETPIIYLKTNASI